MYQILKQIKPKLWTGSGQVCLNLWNDKEETSVHEGATASSNLESHKILMESHKIQASIFDSAYKIYREACIAYGH